MHDNLHGADITDGRITGSTPHNEIKDITERLTSKDGSIKLCYVTPEKVGLYTSSFPIRDLRYLLCSLSSPSPKHSPM